MGIAAGGNINPEGVSMFEPIGGSAPKYTGKNMINPLAAIAALAMLLDVLGEQESSRQVEEAVKQVVKNDIKSMDAGRMGHTTQEVGDLVAKYIAGA
jgi:3-isopropylmalate dehydrogenase